MKELVLIIMDFIVAMFSGSMIIFLVEFSIEKQGLKLTGLSKYMIFAMIVILSGIICGRIMVFLN